MPQEIPEGWGRTVVATATARHRNIIQPDVQAFEDAQKAAADTRARLQRSMMLICDQFGVDPLVQYDTASGEFYKLFPPAPPPPPAPTPTIDENGVKPELALVSGESQPETDSQQPTS